MVNVSKFSDFTQLFNNTSNDLKKTTTEKQEDNYFLNSKSVSNSSIGDELSITKSSGIDQIGEKLTVPGETTAGNPPTELQQQISDKLEELEETRANILTGNTSIPPEQRQRQLELIDRVEKALLTNLKSTYPEGSTQKQAVDSMLKLRDIDKKENDLKMEQAQIDNTIGILTNQLEQMPDQNSPEALKLKQQIETLKKESAQIELEEKKLTIDEWLEKKKLKKNILKSPSEDHYCPGKIIEQI